MNRHHDNKPLLMHRPAILKELSEKEMYEKRFSKVQASLEPKPPPKLSREKVFEADTQSATAKSDIKPKFDFNSIFVSS